MDFIRGASVRSIGKQSASGATPGASAILESSGAARYTVAENLGIGIASKLFGNWQLNLVGTSCFKIANTESVRNR